MKTPKLHTEPEMAPKRKGIRVFVFAVLAALLGSTPATQAEDRGRGEDRGKETERGEDRGDDRGEDKKREGSTGHDVDSGDKSDADKKEN